MMFQKICSIKKVIERSIKYNFFLIFKVKVGSEIKECQMNFLPVLSRLEEHKLNGAVFTLIYIVSW